jgi:hypothetical protein
MLLRIPSMQVQQWQGISTKCLKEIVKASSKSFIHHLLCYKSPVLLPLSRKNSNLGQDLRQACWYLLLNSIWTKSQRTKENLLPGLILHQVNNSRILLLLRRLRILPALVYWNEINYKSFKL